MAVERQNLGTGERLAWIAQLACNGVFGVRRSRADITSRETQLPTPDQD
jgi:hypothetical protein